MEPVAIAQAEQTPEIFQAEQTPDPITVDVEGDGDNQRAFVRRSSDGASRTRRTSAPDDEVDDVKVRSPIADPGKPPPAAAVNPAAPAPAAGDVGEDEAEKADLSKSAPDYEASEAALERARAIAKKSKYGAVEELPATFLNAEPKNSFAVAEPPPKVDKAVLNRIKQAHTEAAARQKKENFDRKLVIGSAAASAGRGKHHQDVKKTVNLDLNAVAAAQKARADEEADCAQYFESRVIEQKAERDREKAEKKAQEAAKAAEATRQAKLKAEMAKFAAEKAAADAAVAEKAAADAKAAELDAAKVMAQEKRIAQDRARLLGM